MKVVIYLLVYLGVPVLIGLLPREHIAATVLGIAYIFLAIPFAILRVIDLYRRNEGTTFLSRVFNVVFRVPLAFFGFVCVAAGFSIIAWVLYNVFVQRQKEYTGPNWIFGFGSFGVAVPLVIYGWATLRSAWRRKEQITPTPEELEEFEHEEDDEGGAAESPESQARKPD